ncbi:MAG: DUF2877 domain-containing protein, partial [Carbonactinosporaceae bacterium]
MSEPGAEPGLPGAAASGVAALLAGPTRPARLIGAFPSAAYLELPGPLDDADPAGTRYALPPAAPAVTPAGTPPGTPSLIALVTSDGIRLPNAVVIAPTTADGCLAGLRGPAGSVRAAVGDHRVKVGELVVDVVRSWAPRSALPPRSAADLRRGYAWLDAALAAAPLTPPAPQTAHGVLPGIMPGILPGGLPLGLLDSLACAAARHDLAAARAAAERLTGLGPGLTPSGDDLLCGFLVTLCQLAPPGLAGWARRLG